MEAKYIYVSSLQVLHSEERIRLVLEKAPMEELSVLPETAVLACGHLPVYLTTNCVDTCGTT